MHTTVVLEKTLDAVSVMLTDRGQKRRFRFQTGMFSAPSSGLRAVAKVK
jgi:hypothetical protein